MVVKFGLVCTATGFVGRYLWDYGFSTEGMTVDILLSRGVVALRKGFLYGGLYFAFPTWLVLTKFPRPKHNKQNSYAEGLAK